MTPLDMYNGPSQVYCFKPEGIIHCLFAELANREIENLHCVETLEEQILDLTDELESRKLREDEQARHHQTEKQQIIDDIEGLRVCYKPLNSLYTGNVGMNWLSGRVLDLRLRGRGFEPHQRHCVVVLEHDTLILA